MAKWYVSDHAVERFIHRIDPRATPDEARRILEQRVLSCARLKGKTSDGHWRYLLDGPAAIAIVKYDGNTNVVKTILSTTGDQGRKWIAISEPIREDKFTPMGHPDWNDLRAETKDALAMMLLRAATKADVRAPIAAWMRMQ